MDENNPHYCQGREEKIPLTKDKMTLNESCNNRKKFDRSVSLVCWAYDEEDSMEEFLSKATQVMEDTVNEYEIVLIDDGSTDKTYEIACDFQKKNPNLKIFRNEKNMDVGISTQRAIQNATKEFLFWQAIDWCYDLSNLRASLEYLKRYDIVQGVRIEPVSIKIGFLRPFALLLKLFSRKHLTCRSDTVPKAIVSVINYLLIRVLFQVPLSDFQSLTFYPTKFIQSIKFESDSSFSNPEGKIKAYWMGKTIKEVPIKFIPRKKGEAKGTRLKAIICSIKDITVLWFKWIVLRRRIFIKKGAVDRLKSLEA